MSNWVVISIGNPDEISSDVPVVILAICYMFIFLKSTIPFFYRFKQLIRAKYILISRYRIL